MVPVIVAAPAASRPEKTLVDSLFMEVGLPSQDVADNARGCSEKRKELAYGTPQSAQKDTSSLAHTVRSKRCL